MRTLLLFLLLIALPASAGTLTINTDSATDTRLLAWCGKRLNLGRSCTAPELKAEFIRMVTIDMQASERKSSSDALTDTPISQMN